MSTFLWWLAFGCGVAGVCGGIALVCWSIGRKGPCVCGCHAIVKFRATKVAGIIAGTLLICVSFALVGTTIVHANNVCMEKEAHCT